MNFELEPLAESQCLQHIINQLVQSEHRLPCFSVVDSDGDDGEDYNIYNLGGMSEEGARETSLRLYFEGEEVSASVLLSTLRTSRLPLFEGTDWLAWDEAAQTLRTNRPYRMGGLKRNFWGSGLSHDPVRATDAKTDVFKLLRSAYLSSDFGTRPLLVSNDHVDDALGRRPVPFCEPPLLSQCQCEDYSLVYFTRQGDVRAVPLSLAYAEEVAVATRAGSLFRSKFGRPTLRPSLTELSLAVNGFSLATSYDLRKFHYVARRNGGTAFESVFRQVDVPEDLRLWHYEHSSIADRASSLADWARERDCRLFVTPGAHPLQSNDCASVSTIEQYAQAVCTLAALGYRLGESAKYYRQVGVYRASDHEQVN